MTLPGLLIEYLISGAMALIWLAPLLAIYGVDVVQTGLLPLLAIALYVVGMAIDFLAYWLVMPLKSPVRARAWRKYGDSNSEMPPPENSVEREIKFALYAPEIAKEVDMRSSRDRIARGAIVNVLIALALRIFADDYLAAVPVWILILTLGLFIAIWWVFQYLSYGYEFKASSAVQRKISEPSASIPHNI
jgi:hypothetical protein